MSNGEAALVGSRVFLGAPDSTHSSIDESTTEGGSGHQHVIKGDDLIVAINNFANAIDTALGTDGGTAILGVPVGNLGAPLTSAIAIHDACEDFKTAALNSLSAIVHTE
jgi:hypothetical protein